MFAKLRLHLTVDKTKSLLHTWLGISLSNGTISRAFLEAGQAVSDLEPSILNALRASGLIHMDETSWKERKILRWLWVAVGDNVVYYTMGSRTTEVVKEILGNFIGRLMTDGYGAYRFYLNRCRCWAHLDRKAKGLSDSWDSVTSTFGKRAVQTLQTLEQHVYLMRNSTGSARIQKQQEAEELEANFCIDLLRNQDAPQEGITQFAREILNDPQAIFAVITDPDLPLTNNAAERALRPLVLMRKISYGTKTEEGSRAITLLASVYETLLKRGAEVHTFLREIFKSRRSGSASPPLPNPA